MNRRQRNAGPLAPQEFEEAVAALADQRDRLRSEIATAEKAESAVRDGGDLDAADVSTTNVAIQELHTRTEDAAALLDRTLAALTRAEQGTFGMCTHCGAAVGRERVMALPHAELCVTCAQRPEVSPAR
ncbi:TraR/DksA family transcriptional regulator [Streptomyces hygroscopicus]|uniref:TraR/DksA family transcriptional regulator n=1 Tax=Streptomyces hygroscopicus TaxID=1912 RepID=UPI0004CA8285|nr:TraR/DksA C4-type zinc finger protein [Streptomyces hygroscopicus]